MRSIIIDDEPKNVRILSKLLTDYCPDVEIIGTAGDANAAKNIIEELNPDLVFLDIQMPNGNAFDLLDKLMPIDFEVIFITAFENYSLKAFKYSALDYLLKPVSIEELQIAVAKAKANNQSSDINQQVKSLLQNIQNAKSGLQKIALHTVHGLEFIKADEIIRLKAEGSYTKIYLKDKSTILASRNIKSYEDILAGDTFFRIHHSHIINLNAIKKYYKGGYVIMDDETTIEVASRRKNDFLSLFK